MGPEVSVSKRLSCLALLGLTTLVLSGAAGAKQVAPGAVLASEARPAVALADVAPTVAPLYARSGMPAPKYAVERFRLTVQSTDELGKPITVTALLYVPVLKGRAPLYVMGPGTTGLADACAPTKEQARVDNWGNYEAHMLSYAAQGFVSILPDWANFDDPSRVQPYFVAASEGRIMLDTARAARAFLAGRAAQPSDKTFLAGFSQGGHAAFAAADLAAAYAPDVPLSGVIGYAPAMDVATLFRERPALGPYLAQSYARYYGIDPAKIIAPRWLSGLEREAGALCVSDVYAHYPNDARSIYRPEFLAALGGGSVQKYDLDLARRLKQNAPGFGPGGLAVPALVVTGLTDPIVTAEAQLSFVRKSCATGRPVTHREYAGANHFQARQFGFADTLAWMRELAADRPVANMCGEARYAMPARTVKAAPKAAPKAESKKGVPVFATEKR